MWIFVREVCRLSKWQRLQFFILLVAFIVSLLRQFCVAFCGYFIVRAASIATSVSKEACYDQLSRKMPRLLLLSVTLHTAYIKIAVTRKLVHILHAKTITRIRSPFQIKRQKCIVLNRRRKQIIIIVKNIDSLQINSFQALGIQLKFLNRKQPL